MPNLFVIYIDDFLQKTTNNNKNLELHNQKLKERNSAEIITDADYADNLVIRLTYRCLSLIRIFCCWSKWYQASFKFIWNKDYISQSISHWMELSYREKLILHKQCRSSGILVETWHQQGVMCGLNEGMNGLKLKKLCKP